MEKLYWDAVWASKIQFGSKNGNSELPPWEIHTHDVYLERVLNVFQIHPCKALELGCGSGYDAAFLSMLGFQTTAIDISENAIDRAKQIHYNSNVNFVVSDIVNDSIEGKFDLIFDRACLHNLDKNNNQWMKIFHKLSLALNDGGKLIIITGNVNQPPICAATPTPTYISDIEYSSQPYFKIVMVNEIVFKCIDDFANCFITVSRKGISEST